MERFLEEENWKEKAALFLDRVDERGRFISLNIEKEVAPSLLRFSPQPEEGWLQYSYHYVLGRLFPGKGNRSFLEKAFKRKLQAQKRQFHAGFSQQSVLFSELDGLQSEVDQATTAGLLPRRKGTDKGGIYATS